MWERKNILKHFFTRVYLRNNYLTRFLTNNDKIIDSNLDFQRIYNNSVMNANANVSIAATRVSFTNFHSCILTNFKYKT